MLKKIKGKTDKIIITRKDFVYRDLKSMKKKKGFLEPKNTISEIKNSIVSNNILVTEKAMFNEPEERSK